MSVEIYDCLLIRHNKGFLYLGDSHGGRELFLKIPTDNVQLAHDIGTEYLALLGSTTSSLAVQGHVFDASQAPNVAYGPNDAMGGDKIVGLNVSMVDEFMAQVTPELRDPMFDLVEAITRRINRLATGGKSEYSKPDIEPQQRGRPTDTTPPPFSMGQEVYRSSSPPWTAPRPYWLAWLEVTLEQPGSTPTHVAVRRNRAILETSVLAPGAMRNVIRVNEGFPPRSIMTLEITVAGTDAAKLSVAPRGTII